jgi:hypothetical protein
MPSPWTVTRDLCYVALLALLIAESDHLGMQTLKEKPQIADALSQCSGDAAFAIGRRIAVESPSISALPFDTTLPD